VRRNPSNKGKMSKGYQILRRIKNLENGKGNWRRRQKGCRIPLLRGLKEHVVYITGEYDIKHGKQGFA